MATIATLMVRLTADVKDFQSKMTKAQDGLNKMSKAMGKTGKDMTKKLTLPLMAVGAGLAKAAMNLEATEAKYNTVFAGMTDTADQFIKDFQKLTPATTASARSMASGIQDLLVPMGFMRDEATKMTGETMHLIGALTNFNSATHSAEDVTTAFQGALTGQYESLKRLGIQVNKEIVTQKVYEMGLAEAGAEVTKAMEAQALMALAYEQSGDALKAYTEENLDAKTRMGLLKAEVVDMAAKMGTMLLPIINDLVAQLRKAVEWFSGLSESQQKTILIIGGVVAAIGPLLIMLSKVAKGLSVAIGAVKALSGAFAFLMANPVVLVLAGIAAAVAGIAYAASTASKEVQAETKKMIAAWKELEEEQLAYIEDVHQRSMNRLQERVTQENALHAENLANIEEKASAEMEAIDKKMIAEEEAHEKILAMLDEQLKKQQQRIDRESDLVVGDLEDKIKLLEGASKEEVAIGRNKRLESRAIELEALVAAEQDEEEKKRLVQERADLVAEIIKGAADKEIETAKWKIREEILAEMEKAEELKRQAASETDAKVLEAERELEEKMALFELEKELVTERKEHAIAEETLRHNQVMDNLNAEIAKINEWKQAMIERIQTDTQEKIEGRKREENKFSNSIAGKNLKKSYEETPLIPFTGITLKSIVDSIKGTSKTQTTDPMGSVFRAPDIDQYATGTPYVPKTGLAMVHEGERITPKSQNHGTGASIIFEKGAFDGAVIMDDYGVDRLMDRISHRLKLSDARL